MTQPLLKMEELGIISAQEQASSFKPQLPVRLGRGKIKCSAPSSRGGQLCSKPSWFGCMGTQQKASLFVNNEAVEKRYIFSVKKGE
jgi:hypothetical protein